jgi:predicted phosphate transport protein (TIGR00153 family)
VSGLVRSIKRRLDFGVVPAANEYFHLFREAGLNVERAGDLLHELMTKWPDGGDLRREILLCEQEGDRLTHDIIHRLNTSSYAPIDRRDILDLASALDDIVDYTDEAADFLELYRIEAPMEQAEQLSAVLRDACRHIAAALARLRELDTLRQYVVEVNRLENEGDRISRDAIASLFVGGVDPIVIIRWKDVFERLEQAIDACEHAAHILEGIVVKHA